jgi:hypothetical protein
VVKLLHELDDLETSKRLTNTTMKQWTNSPVWAVLTRADHNVEQAQPINHPFLSLLRTWFEVTMHGYQSTNDASFFLNIRGSKRI